MTDLTGLPELLHRLHDAGVHEWDKHTAVSLAWSHSPRAAAEIAESMIAKSAPSDEDLTAAGAVTPSAVKAIMEREGLSHDEAYEIAEADRRLAEAKAEFAPVAADVPWLDTRPLPPADLPRPWSDDDFQRDRRRAEATGVLGELGHETWQVYAEAGKDAVAELVGELRDQRVRELELLRVSRLDSFRMARQEAARRAANPDKPAVGVGRLVLDGRGLAI